MKYYNVKMLQIVCFRNKSDVQYIWSSNVLYLFDRSEEK